MNDLNKKLTILLSSCDAYEDLWVPFFTLLKKYWDPANIQILLNTESKEFSFPGLDIQCVHCPGETRYGKRMLNALKKVKTPYVLSMLDDFFLRSPVDETRIRQIIDWMEADKNIVYFSCDPNQTYADWEVDKYPGFRRIPPGNSYVLSLQAAIWRTDQFIKYWPPNVNPWEWEMVTNAKTFMHFNHKFYCLTASGFPFFDYGHYQLGDIWGVFRGKWVIEDVGPLFEKEGIKVDFSQRGIYVPGEKKQLTRAETSEFKKVIRCLGWGDVPLFMLHCMFRRFRNLVKKPWEYDYFGFLTLVARMKFHKQYWE